MHCFKTRQNGVSKKETKVGLFCFVVIDLFTDTAAILNYLNLSSIMGCPGGMSTIRGTRISIIDARFSGQFFFKFS